MKKEIAIILTATAILSVSCRKDKKEAAAEVPEIDVTNVITDSVLLSKSYPGALAAVSKIDVVGRVNGQILTTNYTFGDHVNKGQVLFTIESDTYRDRVAQAQASLATAKSEYEYASKHYDAMQKALQSDAVSKIEVLQAKSAMETSAAAIKNAQAALETAQTNLGYCTVHAPISGLITRPAFGAGAYISGEGSPVVLATIYDSSEIYANFNIEDVTFIRAFIDADRKSGHPKIDYGHVPVRFSESLSRPYTGRLYYISPDVDTSTGTIFLRLRIDNPDGELRDGMYVTVDLPYERLSDAILVKDAAITTSQSRKFIYTVNDSNKVVYTPIEVGDMANDTMRVVTSGLRGDERYVTKAMLKVRPGMTVKPVLTK